MVWPIIAGAALAVGGGLFGRNSARKAAAAAQRAAEERAARVRQYGADAVGRFQTLADEMPQGFRAWNIKTGLGNWNIDPTTGTAEAVMDPTAKAYQDWAFDQSALARNQLGNFDRNAFAQQEFQRGQGLLQESRDANLSNLLGSLQRKGLAGFGQTAAGGTSTAQTNPLLATLFDRQNRQDLELMDRSFGAADTQMDRLYGRATGLFDRGYGMNDDLNTQLDMGLRMGEQDRLRAFADWQNRWKALSDTEKYQEIAALGGMQDQARASDYSIQAKLGGNMGIANMFGQAGQLLMSGGASALAGGGQQQQQPQMSAYQNYTQQGWTPAQAYGNNGTMWGGW